MSADQSERERTVAEWYFQGELGHKGQRPKPEVALIYMKTLIDVAATDGTLNNILRYGKAEAIRMKNLCSNGRSSNNDISRTYLNNPSGKLFVMFL
ncbi:unnamed protein product [Rotaria sp. Silwood1]|nr:unnamed protein product [Rotaria sp. Silwood1]